MPRKPPTRTGGTRDNGHAHDYELTCAMKPENGNPLSLAKDQVWRDTVATVLMQAEVMLTMRMEVIIDVPA